MSDLNVLLAFAAGTVAGTAMSGITIIIAIQAQQQFGGLVGGDVDGE